MSKNRDIASSWQEFLEARRREGKPLRKLQYAENDISKAWADLYADDEVAPPDPVETWIEAEAEFERAKTQRNAAYNELHAALDILLRNDDKGLKPDEKDWTFDKDKIEKGYLLIETWPEVRKSPGRQRDIVKQQLTAFDKDKLKAELAAIVVTTRTKKDELTTKLQEAVPAMGEVPKKTLPLIPHKERDETPSQFKARQKVWYDEIRRIDMLEPEEFRLYPAIEGQRLDLYTKLLKEYDPASAA